LSNVTALDEIGYIDQTKPLSSVRYEIHKIKLICSFVLLTTILTILSSIYIFFCSGAFVCPLTLPHFLL